jgi:hypothetical protein
MISTARCLHSTYMLPQYLGTDYLNVMLFFQLMKHMIQCIRPLMYIPWVMPRKEKNIHWGIFNSNIGRSEGV